MTDYVTPAEQAKNLIRYIGDNVKKTGCHINIAFSKTPGIIGAQSLELAQEIIYELQERRLIKIGQRYVKGGR